MDLPSASAGLGSGLLIGILFSLPLYLKSRRLESALRGLEEKAQRLREACARKEYRLERFDVLWYPTVTVDPDAQQITGVSPGLPHCKKCRAALSAQNGGWACSKCGDRRPDSLADTVITDTVTREALSYFQERNPSYKLKK